MENSKFASDKEDLATERRRDDDDEDTGRSEGLDSILQFIILNLLHFSLCFIS